MQGGRSFGTSTMSCNRALILAAGRGSRAGHLTEDRPKCLLALGGRPLLDWQLTALKEGGVSEIGLVTGYRADQLAVYGLPSFHNSLWSKSNIVASLLVASGWLEQGSSLVAYSDIVYHSDWVSRLRICIADIAIAYDTLWRELWEERFEHPEIDAESFRVNGGLVQDLGKKAAPLDEIQG